MVWPILFLSQYMYVPYLRYMALGTSLAIAHLEDNLHLVLVALALLVPNKPTAAVEGSGRVAWLTLCTPRLDVRSAPKKTWHGYST